MKISAASQTPVNISWSSCGFDWEGKNPDSKIDLTYVSADEEYVDTIGLEIIQGRKLSKNFPADKADSVLVNETSARMIGPGSPVGKQFMI